MKNIAFVILGLFCFAAACTDPELDPFQLDKLTKGSILALRGTAYENLQEIDFRGAVDKLSLTADPAAEKFEFDGAFLSDDINSLSQVDVYARRTETGPRVRLLTVPASAFSTPSGEKYPQASFSIPVNEILTALSITMADLAVNDYLFIESDLTLNDGTVVPAEAIANSSLFESDLFYPAHKLRLLIVD